MTLERAKDIAEYTIERVGKFCEIILPVGSIRRECKEVKDIDLLLLPKYHDVISPDLFGTGVSEKVISPNFLQSIKALGKIEKGDPSGKYIQINVRNVKVDMFIPNAFDFYRMLCIRTGSNAYVRNHIPNAWRRLGWVGTDNGLRRLEDCRVFVESNGRRRFEVLKDSGARPPVWKSEIEFFEWMQVPYVEPKDRTEF